MQQSADHCFTCWERNPQTSANVPGWSTEAEMEYFLWDLQSCSTIQIWEKFGLWDVLFSFMLNDALDSLLAAFQHFHIGVSLLTSRTDSFLAFLCRVCISSTAQFYRRLSNIASLSLRSAARALSCVCPGLKAFLRPLMLNSTANRHRPRRLISQMIFHKRSLRMEAEHHLGACVKHQITFQNGEIW